jgi:hypothetical protein
MTWLNSEREYIKEQYRLTKVTDVARKAGELWRAMSPAEKAKWETKRRRSSSGNKRRRRPSS